MKSNALARRARALQYESYVIGGPDRDLSVDPDTLKYNVAHYIGSSFVGLACQTSPGTNGKQMDSATATHQFFEHSQRTNADLREYLAGLDQNGPCGCDSGSALGTMFSVVNHLAAPIKKRCVPATDPESGHVYGQLMVRSHKPNDGCEYFWSPALIYLFVHASSDTPIILWQTHRILTAYDGANVASTSILGGMRHNWRRSYCCKSPGSSHPTTMTASCISFLTPQSQSMRRSWAAQSLPQATGQATPIPWPSRNSATNTGWPPLRWTSMSAMRICSRQTVSTRCLALSMAAVSCSPRSLASVRTSPKWRGGAEIGIQSAMQLGDNQNWQLISLQ